MMFEFLWNYRKNRFAKNAITAEKLKSRRFLLDDFQCCNHIIFSKYATTGDGIITALKMMEVMLAKKKTLSELKSPVAIFPQVLKNIKVTDKTMAQNDIDVKAAVEKVAEALGNDGRILVRESGTEPVVRVMVEAGSQELCVKYVDEVIEVIKSKGYAI